MPNDKGVLRISLQGCRREPVGDPKTLVRFQRSATGDEFRRFDDVAFPVGQARVFNLPTADEEWKIFYRLAPQDFHMAQSWQFSLVAGKPEHHVRILMRKPSRSKAVFRQWSGLGAKFGTTKKLLRNAARLQIYLKTSKDLWDVGPLSGADYNSLDGRDVVAVKAAMLNVTTKLRSTSAPRARAGASWLDLVDELLVLRPQRILAVAKPALVRFVEQIRDHGADGYKSAMAPNHYKFIPTHLKSQYSIRKKDMFSVKTKESKGNLQLTLAPGTDDNGKPIHLLDADIDESGTLLGHIRDVLKHKFTGGTDPFYVHQILCYQEPTIDLGYDLTAK